MIVIVLGLPGSGKSYFAARLAELIKAVYINSDRVRKEMVAHSSYTTKEKLAVYDEMLARMRQALSQEKDVVLDATFYKDDIRKKFVKSVQLEDKLFFIEIRADEQLIRERLRHPRPDSEADFKVYKIIQAQWESLREPHLLLQSTGSNLDEMLRRTMDYLDYTSFDEQ